MSYGPKWCFKHDWDQVSLAPGKVILLLLLLQVCCLPVAVLGLLQHSQQLLSDEAVYGEERIIVMLPNHLSVLHRAACEQPGMIPKVSTWAVCELCLSSGVLLSGTAWLCCAFR